MWENEKRQQSERRHVEYQLATQCAPLMAGLKPSNLLIIPAYEAQTLEQVLNGTGFSCYCMTAYKEKAVFFLYRITELVVYLTEPEVQKLLLELGYDSCELYSLLQSVSARYGEHLRCKSDFPHELGLLLGYPAVDVRGFMENQGKNCLYSGYWKVYGNLTETRHLFCEFAHAKGVIEQLVAGGSTILDVVELFRKKHVRERLAV